MKVIKFHKILMADPWVLEVLRPHLVPISESKQSIKAWRVRDFVKNKLESLSFRPFESIRERSLASMRNKHIMHVPEISPAEKERRDLAGEYAFNVGEWVDSEEFEFWLIHYRFEDEEKGERISHWVLDKRFSLEYAAMEIIDLSQRASRQRDIIIDAVSRHSVPGKGDTRMRIEIYNLDKKISELAAFTRQKMGERTWAPAQGG
ncbi:MAG: hypothetical protein Q8L10_02705 [Candidatus Moranbacteria bacterium]|nr:hypothetical protein [Candidatus Moranbacteria bacterium]